MPASVYTTIPQPKIFYMKQKYIDDTASIDATTSTVVLSYTLIHALVEDLVLSAYVDSTGDTGKIVLTIYYGDGSTFSTGEIDVTETTETQKYTLNFTHLVPPGYIDKIEVTAYLSATVGPSEQVHIHLTGHVYECVEG